MDTAFIFAGAVQFFLLMDPFGNLPFFISIHAPMTAFQLISLMLAGCCGCAGQFAITSAYRFAPAREISVYDYTQVIFAALLGWMFFQQIPDGYSILGYIIICGTGVAMFFYQKNHPA